MDHSAPHYDCHVGELLALGSFEKHTYVHTQDAQNSAWRR